MPTLLEQAVADLSNIDRHASINISFANKLYDRYALGRDKVSPEKIAELQGAENSCTVLIHSFIKLKSKLLSLPPEAKNGGPGSQELSNVRMAAASVYTTGLAFTNALLAKDQPKAEFLTLTQDCIDKAYNLLMNPRSSLARTELDKATKKLNYQLETNPLLHGLWTVGRVFVGALGCLLGASIALASVFTGVGLLLTLGFGLFTWGKSWGPLSLGKKLFVSSADLMFSGPNSHQRATAKNLAEPLVEMSKNSEALTP